MDIAFTLLLVAAAFTLGLTLGTVHLHIYMEDFEDDDIQGQDSEQD